MAPVVNFLPWRQHKRRRSAYVWIATFSVTCLGIALVGTAWRVKDNSDLRIAMLWQHSDEALISALKVREKPLQVALQHWQEVQNRVQRRRHTQAWRQILFSLATVLPQQVWLTQLRWQQNQLELWGLTRSVGELSELEQRLLSVAGFRLQQRGATERDVQGRWQFHYQLRKEQPDASH